MVGEKNWGKCLNVGLAGLWISVWGLGFPCEEPIYGIFSLYSWSKGSILHNFICEKTEAQKGFMICPGKHGN